MAEELQIARTLQQSRSHEAQGTHYQGDALRQSPVHPMQTAYKHKRASQHSMADQYSVSSAEKRASQIEDISLGQYKASPLDLA